MNKTSQANRQKILIILLGLAVLVLVLVSYKNIIETKDKLTFLEKQKEEVQTELESMAQELQQLTIENDSLRRTALTYRESIEQLLDSMTRLEADYNTLLSYRQQIRQLRSANNQLLTIVDSVQRANETLQGENERMVSEIAKLRQSRQDSVPKKPREDRLIRISDFKVKAFRETNTGSLVETSRASRTQRIQASFIILPDQNQEKEDKDLFAVFKNSMGKPVQPYLTQNYKNKIVLYHKIIPFYFNNENFEVIVNLSVKKLPAGFYSIEIYDGLVKIGSGDLELR